MREHRTPCTRPGQPSLRTGRAHAKWLLETELDIPHQLASSTFRLILLPQAAPSHGRARGQLGLQWVQPRQLAKLLQPSFCHLRDRRATLAPQPSRGPGLRPTSWTFPACIRLRPHERDRGQRKPRREYMTMYTFPQNSRKTVACLLPSQPANLCPFSPHLPWPPLQNQSPVHPYTLQPPLYGMLILPSTGALSLCGFCILFNKMHFTFFFFK